MIGLLLEDEADCLIRQHTEPRGGPPMNRTRCPEPSTARAVSFIGQKGTIADVCSNGRSWKQIGRSCKRHARDAPQAIVITKPFLNLFVHGSSIFFGVH
ncbi:hypothetical protein [Paraburkholderia aspalathi]|uniref:hypothetical protein n=1 Tax=Paraburkholderia aspalathi TaxID=1324617 RepID=UPI0038BC9F01